MARLGAIAEQRRNWQPHRLDDGVTEQRRRTILTEYNSRADSFLFIEDARRDLVEPGWDLEPFLGLAGNRQTGWDDGRVYGCNEGAVQVPTIQGEARHLVES